MYGYYLKGKISDYMGKYKGKWVQGKIFLIGHCFDVLVGENNNLTLIKPSPIYIYCKTCKGDKRGYHTSKYEQIFGFNYHCKNFNLKKKINITDAITKKEWVVLSKF